MPSCFLTLREILEREILESLTIADLKPRRAQIPLAAPATRKADLPARLAQLAAPPAAMRIAALHDEQLQDVAIRVGDHAPRYGGGPIRPIRAFAWTLLLQTGGLAKIDGSKLTLTVKG